MITREVDYAIRIALHLAQVRQAGRLGAVACNQVARAADVPYRFLRKIVPRLAAAGLIVSTRGRCGGIRLARPPRRVSLLDLVQATGASGVQLGRCMARPAACARSRTCRVHRALRGVQRTVNRQLQAQTLDKLA